MKKIVLLLGLINALILVPSLLAEPGDEPIMRVFAKVNRAELTIGDPVEYTVLIEHSPSIEILSQISPPDLDILKIQKIEDLYEEEETYISEGRKFTLTTFQLGEFILGPTLVSYRDENGILHSIRSNKLYVTVKSIAEGEEKTDIRAIKDVLSLESTLARYAVYGALGILALLLLFLIALRILRRKKEAILTPAAKLSPEEEALQRLNRLFESDLIRRGEYKLYHLELSETLKSYFERRLRIHALEATTIEIMRDMASKKLDSSLMDMTRKVLEGCDLAKFAKWRPQPTEIIQLNHQSKKIIETLSPKTSDGMI